MEGENTIALLFADAMSSQKAGEREEAQTGAIERDRRRVGVESDSLQGKAEERGRRIRAQIGSSSVDAERRQVARRSTREEVGVRSCRSHFHIIWSLLGVHSCRIVGETSIIKSDAQERRKQSLDRLANGQLLRNHICIRSSKLKSSTRIH